MLLPAARNLFETIFLSAAAPFAIPEGLVALFLASNNIDVWGMDYGWSFVPPDNKDFIPLKRWDLEKDTEHTQIALSIARWMRVTSGQGVGPIPLLGFSYGASLAYAVANEDSQRQGNLRNVKGIIIVDGGSLKAVPGSSAQMSACNKLPDLKANLDSIFHTAPFASFRSLGLAALNAPNEKSASLPLFTNYNALPAALVITGFLSGSVKAPNVTLNYTDASRLPALAAMAPPFLPYQWNYDVNASLCESDDYPTAIDDHFEEITVPIFYLSRGEAGFYTTMRTGSRDLSNLVLTSPNPTYGHADLFLANNAAGNVWQPILNWILDHR